jgi:ElaB/YqjD/DUF883 family membrane-anchored ribosome-binding protein
MTDDLRDKASARYARARDRVTEASTATKEKADEALRKARLKASETASATRASANKAAQKTVEGVAHSPLVAVLGGLALGAIAAALLPKTSQENAALGKAGAKIRDTARAATRAARAAGRDQLDTLGVSTDAARDQLRGLADKISKAATTASTAAADAMRKR